MGVHQLPHQLAGFFLAAAQRLAHRGDGVVEIGAALLVLPAASQREAQAIQQQGVEQLRVGGDAAIPRIVDQCLGDAVKGEFAYVLF